MCTELTGYLKPNKSEEKRDNSNDPLKLLFLIRVPFNFKIMHFVLIHFHSVGKASEYLFLPDVAIFSGLVYK